MRRTEVTFLDLVREISAMSLARCDEECTPGLHREEAARFLGALVERDAARHLRLLIQRPDLVRALLDVARRVDRCDPEAGYHSSPHKGCVLR